MHHLRLLLALRFGRPRGRLVRAEERLVAALGIEVVADDEDGVAVERELAGQRLAAVGERGVLWVNPAGIERKVRGRASAGDADRTGRRVVRRAGGAARRWSDEGDAAIGAVEEDDADIAAGLPAVLVVLPG